MSGVKFANFCSELLFELGVTFKREVWYGRWYCSQCCGIFMHCDGKPHLQSSLPDLFNVHEKRCGLKRSEEAGQNLKISVC